MQSTGTYDKNKKEIYEGDVIKLVETIRVLCEFGTARRNINGNLVDITGFYFKLESGFKSFPIVENYLGKHDLELFEIIGNVYETPELFKLKKMKETIVHKSRNLINHCILILYEYTQFLKI